MEYPKPCMNKKELIKMGIPEKFLDRAIASPGQTFAQRINPVNKTSPVMFDTEGFEKWRIKDAQMQNSARVMRSTIAG